MEKTISPANKVQAHSLDETESFGGKTMKPRAFEILASNGEDNPPIQRQPNPVVEYSSSINKTPNDLKRDNLLVNTGSVPNKNSPNSKTYMELSAETQTVSGSMLEYNGLNLLHGNAKASANLGVTKRGVKGGVGAEVSGSLIQYQNKWNLGPFKINIFGEQTSVDLVVSVKGLLGVEAKAQLEVNAGKIQSTKDIRNISEKNLKYGIEGGLDAFAGVKIEVGAEANYTWIKQKKKVYVEKFKRNASLIIQEVAKINPDVGSWLQELPLEEAEELLGGLLYGLGADGQVTLAEATVGGWVGYGAGLQASAGARITKGKFYYHAKMGIAWGLGFGGNVSIGLDLVEGTLFGLAVGGELLPTAIAELKRLISKENMAAMGKLVWDRLKSWRAEKGSKQGAGEKQASSISLSSSSPLASRPAAPMCDASTQGKNTFLQQDFSKAQIGTVLPHL